MDADDRRVESWFTDVLEELLISKPSCGLPGTCVFPTCWNTSRSTNINVLQLFSNFKSQTSGETHFSARSPLLRVPKKYIDIFFPMFRCSYSHIPCILLDASGHRPSQISPKEPMRQSTVENFWRSQRGTWGGQQPSLTALKTNMTMENQPTWHVWRFAFIGGPCSTSPASSDTPTPKLRAHLLPASLGNKT